jgi:hypothetical protein
MLCSGCGFDNSEGTKFCGECGTPLARGCGHCGAENPPGFKFCGPGLSPKIQGKPSVSWRRFLVSHEEGRGERAQTSLMPSARA